MLSKISVRIVHAMSIKNRTQNFFDMNPIHPDHGEKNFDIYNSQRKKINVLDQSIKYQKRRQDLKALARRKIYYGNYLKYERYTDGKNFQVDKKTDLLYGMNSEFDEFIERYKRDLYVDQTAGSQFKQALLKLIYKYKCKSEVELMKLFRISIAKSRAGSLVQKLRGRIMKQAVIKASQEKQKQQLQEIQQSQLEEDKKSSTEQQIEGTKKEGLGRKIREQKIKNRINRKIAVEETRVSKKFNLILKRLDQKIEQAEQSLRYDIQGIPKHLSNYDSKYGWRQTRNQGVNENYDLDVNVGYPVEITTSSQPETVYDLQDWSIRTRINRLYFLKRLQYLNKKKNTFNTELFLKDLPINIRSNDKIMNQLAHKYKEQQLIQMPDLQEIHRQVDAAVDKIYVNIASGRKNSEKKDQPSRQEVYDRAPPQQQFLWENIVAEEILCDTMYNQDQLKNIVLTEESALKLSPSPNTQLSLLKIPINLYRHTELDCIGMFNQYRQKLGDKLMNEEEMDFQPQFKQFSVQQAKVQYRRIKSRASINLNKDTYGRGRRKKAVAQCKVRPGIGVVTINNRNIQDYFGDTYHRVEALKPLIITETAGKYDIDFRVRGSGLKGQSECMSYALARALMKINPEFRNYLYYFGLVGSDTRQKEAKKTNLYSARVRPPYVRR